MLPTDRRRSPFRRLLVYFGLAENPGNPGDQPVRSKPPMRRNEPPRGKARATLAYFGLVEGSASSRYGLNVKPELDDDLDALRARVAELEARLAAPEAGR